MLELQCKRRKKWRKRLKIDHKVCTYTSSIELHEVHNDNTLSLKVSDIAIYTTTTTQLLRYKYFSSGLLFRSQDPYPEHIKKLDERVKRKVMFVC